MWRKHLIGICFASLIFLGFTSLYLLYSPLTSDRKLIENFYKHQVNFEELVKMANEDGEMKSVYRSAISPNSYNVWMDDNKKGFSPRRLNEYKEVFSQFGNPLIHRISKKGEIIEIASASIASFSINEYEDIVITKGYAYSLKEPSPLIDSLDGIAFKTQGTFYKKIGENWYLYFHSGVSKRE